MCATKTLHEKSIPRAKYLSILPTEDPNETFLLALSTGLFKEDIFTKYGNIFSKEKLAEVYLKEAEKKLTFPNSDEYSEYDYVPHGTTELKSLDKKFKRLEKIFDNFR